MLNNCRNTEAESENHEISLPVFGLLDEISVWNWSFGKHTKGESFL